MDDWTLPRPRLALLLDHFATVEDARRSWRVAYPLREVLLLVVCGTIADGDDYDDIVDWGEAHLDFPRRFSAFHHGIPCVDWLRTLMNRVDPDLFSACFQAWVAECWPERAQQVAIDGKTSRRSHDRKAGKPPLHLVSAFATNARLVLGQEAVDEKSNEIVAKAFGEAVRSHWAIENSLHWVLDVTSRRTCRASEPATEPGTWPSCATSPSTSCDNSRTPAA